MAEKKLSPELNSKQKENTLWFINVGQPLIALLDQEKNFQLFASKILSQPLIDTSIFQISKEFGKSIEKFGILTNDFYSSILPFQKVIEDFRQTYTLIGKALSHDLYGLGELAKSFREKSDLDREVLLSSGWWISPIFNDLPYNLINKAAYRYKSGDKHSITNFFKSTFHGKDYFLLRHMVNSWKNKPLFKPRMKAINQAMNAHIRGEYYLSIPTLLPISEGIAEAYCKRARIPISRRDRSKGGLKISNALVHRQQALDSYLYLPEIILYHLQNIIFSDTDLIKTNPNRKLLNRHNILHGKTVNYGDAARSLRCFLLLDVLSALDNDKV